MLKYNNENLQEIHKIALQKGCNVVDFYFEWQQVKDYNEFLHTINDH